MEKRFKFDIKDHTQKNETSILFRFDLKGRRFKYGTAKTILPELWDMGNMRPTNDREKINQVKKKRPQIETELKNIHDRLENIVVKTKQYFANKELAGEPVNFTELKSYLDKSFRPTNKELRPVKAKPHYTQQTLPHPLIKDLIYNYIKGMHTGKKLTKNKKNYDHKTIKAYMTLKNMFDDLEIHFDRSYQVTDISADFEADLHELFNEVKNYTPNTKGKMIKMIKTIIHDFLDTEAQRIYDCHKKGIETTLTSIDLAHIERQLNRIIKPTSKTVNIALDETELKALYDIDLKHKPHLDRARDIFLTGCYTGLRHSDYSRIGPEHIKKEYIHIITVKGKASVNIPNTPPLMNILKKWQYNIPDMTSQELGRYIKEIGQMADITQMVEITEDKGNQTIISKRPKYEMITTHTARRSFATNMFYAGMNSLDIMAITGHKKLDTFQKYIIHDPTRNRNRG